MSRQLSLSNEQYLITRCQFSGEKLMQSKRQRSKNRLGDIFGFGAGVKWTNNQPTGQEALLVFVQKKIDSDMLSPATRIPSVFDGIKTDVVPVGIPEACVAPARNRPMMGGNEH